MTPNHSEEHGAGRHLSEYNECEAKHGGLPKHLPQTLRCSPTRPLVRCTPTVRHGVQGQGLALRFPNAGQSACGHERLEMRGS
jgi:hypothetical protein